VDNAYFKPLLCIWTMMAAGQYLEVDISPLQEERPDRWVGITDDGLPFAKAMPASTNTRLGYWAAIGSHVQGLIPQ
jgi:hypothetical protein